MNRRALALFWTTLALLVSFAASRASALDYTCPSDPGFCYFDVGTDVASFNASNAVLVQAENDVVIHGGIRVKKSCNNPITCHEVEIVSLGGDVELGARTKYFGSEVHITSAGNVTLGAKVQARLRVEAQGIRVQGTGSFRAEEDDVFWDAGAGSVIADAVKIDASENVTIRAGSIQLGGTGKSKLKVHVAFPTFGVHLEATGAISVEGAEILADEIVFDTTGTSVSLTESRVKGLLPTSDTLVQTGPGSTCVFTGTQFFTTLDHDCGTVIGF